MDFSQVTTVQKAIAYLTRDEQVLLVFEGPDHDGLQVPKGTVEPPESPREALFREVVEESGIATLEGTQHLRTDVWWRRRSPPRVSVRHFFQANVYEPRNAWQHTVEGEGPECGREFEYSWIVLPAQEEFALDLDDYLCLLTDRHPF